MVRPIKGQYHRVAQNMKDESPSTVGKKERKGEKSAFLFMQF